MTSNSESLQNVFRLVSHVHRRLSFTIPQSFIRATE